LLALTGGALGLLLAGWGTRAALNLVPVTLPRASEVHLSMPVLGFTLLVSLAVGILFGLLPALKVSRQKPQDALKEGGRGVSGSRHRAQNTLVICEMAMALVLLVGAGLMIHSLVVLSRVDPGFQPRGVFTLTHTAPSSMANAPADAVRAYYREVVRRMKQVPGVQGVSLSDGALPLGDDDEQLFWLENEPKPANTNDMHWALQYTIEPDYLSIMRIPLLRGRFFTDADREHAPRVVVIDDVFARKFFSDDNPVGKHINLDGYDEKATVVGVVGHVMQWGLDNDSSQPLRAQMYLPFMQLRDERMSMSNLGTDVVVRSDSDTTAALSGIRQAMRQMNQQQVVSDAETMEHVISESLAARRFSMILLAVFAGLALILASVGMYGVISYLVGQRTHEIGIRIALGADRRDVLRWVLEQGGRLTLTGIAAGLIAALALTRVMARSSILFGVHVYDPWTLAGVTVLLMAVALAACYVPATRAMRIDPMSALRNE
jgi:predicted permease